MCKTLFIIAFIRKNDSTTWWKSLKQHMDNSELIHTVSEAIKTVIKLIHISFFFLHRLPTV